MLLILCSGGVVAYLFQIDWNEDLLNEIWDCWIDDDTPKEEYASRIAAFEAIKVPVKYVDKYSTKKASVSKNIKLVDDYKTVAFNDFMNNYVIKSSFTSLESSNENLSLKTTVYSTHPITAKIGTKEGLKTDYTFYTYDNVLMSNNIVKQKRVGVIMATNKITNNQSITTGETKPSVFYQYAGRKVEPGQTMVEKKKLHLALELGANMYSVGSDETTGFNFGIEYDRYITLHSQLYVSVGGNIDKSGWNAGLNLGYGFRMNNFSLYPVIGCLYDSLNEKDLSGTDADKKSNYAILGQFGIKTNITIAYPLQLYIHAGYNKNFAQGDWYKENMAVRKIDGLFANAGLRFCF